MTKSPLVALSSSFSDPSLGTAWTVLLVAALCTSLAWSYSLLLPLSVMPAQRGAFSFLKPEQAALLIPRRIAFFLQKPPAVAADSAGEWNRLRLAMASDYANHRHVHAAFFCVARALVVPATGTAALFSIACLTHALHDGSLAAAWLAGASMVYATFPFIITTMAARYRWRRRAPFEVLWLHESMVVLARHEKNFRSQTLERAEVWSDVADMEFILMERYRGSGSGTAEELARKHWSALMLTHASAAASFQGQPRPSSTEVWFWLYDHINRISAAINDRQSVTASIAYVRGTSRRRLTYSADRAGKILLLFLMPVFAACVVGTAWTSGVLLTALPWERVPILLTTLTSLLPILGAVATFVQIMRRGRREP